MTTYTVDAKFKNGDKHLKREFSDVSLIQDGVKDLLSSRGFNVTPLNTLFTVMQERSWKNRISELIATGETGVRYCHDGDVINIRITSSSSHPVSIKH